MGIFFLFFVCLFFAVVVFVVAANLPDCLPFFSFRISGGTFFRGRTFPRFHDKAILTRAIFP